MTVKTKVRILVTVTLVMAVESGVMLIKGRVIVGSVPCYCLARPIFIILV